jgi:hypothetical protein
MRFEATVARVAAIPPFSFVMLRRGSVGFSFPGETRTAPLPKPGLANRKCVVVSLDGKRSSFESIFDVRLATPEEVAAAVDDWTQRGLYAVV